MHDPGGYPQAIVGRAEPIGVRRIESASPGVDYLWRVRWDIAEPYEQAVVPQPRVHLAAEDGRLLVHGVTRRPFSRRLVGRGHVLGASFLPGGFHGRLRGPVGGLSDVVRPAGEVLGVDDRPYAARILTPDATDEAMVDVLTGYLAEVGYEADPRAEEVGSLVTEAERDRTLVRADALAARGGVSLRTLQREFATYVGIGPKWVLQRFRLLDAAAAARSGEAVDWAALAVALGFTDQAHLVRRFTEVVGTPPATYAREVGDPAG
ncbi:MULTISPECIES: helix-turn-helix domain-containing protein [Mumia]|uniref:helix-turn-helix domain-containing protein n=1 Tax=Mumia TaxID=1546255 RepID=UPI00141E95B2|nr:MULTISPECIES: helix-turn-helix domain-containing protein [unclassified Mumia]QMW67478.1 AraC family transcriptional regulator [Mumia sp. ZJ1417]